MKKLLAAGALWAVMVSAVFGQTSQSNIIDGECIVMLQGGSDKDAFLRSLNATGLAGGFEIKQVLSERYRIYLLSFDPTLINTEKIIYDISRNEYVALAQHNHIVQHRATPNDPSFAGQQWGMNNTGQTGGTNDADIDAPEAWNITTGGVTATGDTIVVAVIDGGFQLTHTDLQANIFRNYDEIAGNGVDDDGNGYVDDINGWDAYNNDGGVPSDQHGTHVAGIIGARGNNSTGVAGVNWNVKILPVAGSSGNEATVVRAYSYVAAMRELYNTSNGTKGAFVVSTNASFGVDFGQPASYPIWCAFYDTLGTLGILNAGAGPNSNTNIDAQGDIPTTCPSLYMIAVTNTTNTDARNNSCGYGPINMDIGAPGTNIYSTVPTSTYQNLTGTSMATPHVAGAIGLYYAAACPLFIQDYKQNPSALALQMRSYLLTGVDSITSMATTTSSRGRLNLHKGILKLQTYNCNPNSPPQAGFAASTISGCPGTTVTFSNTTIGAATSWLWQFPGGTPSTSTLQAPTVTYNSLGSYTVTLIATNAFGSDTLVQTNYININNSSVQTIFTEDFSIPNFGTTGWTTENADGLNTWELTTVAGNNPGTTAARVNIFANQGNAPTTDGLITPVIDLSSHSSVELNFEHAHRRRTASVRDSLWVLVSTDGGSTFPYSLLRAGENGTGTFATNSLLTSSFVPTGGTDWCFTDASPGCFTVDLSAFDGQPNVKVKFVIQNNGGNNVYIDNVEITGVCSGNLTSPPVAQFTSNDQTICAGQTVTYTDQSPGNPTSWNWTFSGGTPGTSTLQNPVVTYNTPGTYSARLIVTNLNGGDTVLVNNYITVNALPATPLITEASGTLQSSYATGNQWYNQGNPISGATGNTYTPTQSGTYTVVHTDANGCTATSAPFQFTTGLPGETSASFSVYPNPVRDILQIQLNGDASEWSFRLMDITGKILMQQSPSTLQVPVDLSAFRAGIYLVEMRSGNYTKTVRIIKL